MCTFCGGSLKSSNTEYVEKQGNYIVVIQNIPCEECVQCGETYFSNDVMKKIESILNSIQMISSEISVTVIEYSKMVA